MKRTLALDIGGTNFSIAIFEDRSLIQVETHPTLRDAGPIWMLQKNHVAPQGPQWRGLVRNLRNAS